MPEITGHPACLAPQSPIRMRRKASNCMANIPREEADRKVGLWSFHGFSQPRSGYAIRTAIVIQQPYGRQQSDRYGTTTRNVGCRLRHRPGTPRPPHAAVENNTGLLAYGQQQYGAKQRAVWRMALRQQSFKSSRRAPTRASFAALCHRGFTPQHARYVRMPYGCHTATRWHTVCSSMAS
jgi:hypothetical protein